MSNSGIDFTKKRNPIFDNDGNVIGYNGYEVDHALCKQAREELDYIDRNKGKFVPVYDDETDRQLTDLEVAAIEEREALRLPYIIIDVDTLKMKEELIKANRKQRKYKPRRVLISTELRQQVYERDNYTCKMCGKYDVNQIHHIDKDPSHTWLGNLILLCYDCHLEADGKKKYRIKKNEEK